MSQDRDLVEEERQARLAARADDRTRPSTGSGGMDAGTRKLAIVAGGLGGLLVLMVGGWSLLGHHPSGIPILAPPAGPVRVKPLDPGGMQLMGPQVALSDASGAQVLAPGPEQAAPQALQAEVDHARQVDHPAAAPASPPAKELAPSSGAPTPTPAPAASTPASAATVAAGSAATPASPPAREDAAPETPAAVPPVSTPAASPSAGRYQVQLAALDSEAAARAEWARVSHRAPALFAERAPVIASTSRDGKLFYRLRTGGFTTIAAATAFCGQAKQAGIACTLADF